MEDYLPEDTFYTLHSLACSHGHRIDSLENWIRTGKLSACVWLPVMSVFSRIGLKLDTLTHFEGYAHISRHVCARLFWIGHAGFREFSCFETNDIYVLPESSPEIQIKYEDVRICHDQIKTLNTATKPADVGDSLDYWEEHFRTVTIQERLYHFGATQARICAVLFLAAKGGQPWRFGQQVLHKARSRSMVLGNVFKHHPAYPLLIESDGRGRYRLRPEFCAKLNSYFKNT